MEHDPAESVSVLPVVAVESTNKSDTNASPPPFNAKLAKNSEHLISSDSISVVPPSPLPPQKRDESLDNNTREQILRFWNHPSLRQVSQAEKDEFLKQKGFTTEQVYQAGDRIVPGDYSEQTSSNRTCNSTAFTNANPIVHQANMQPQQQQSNHAFASPGNQWSSYSSTPCNPYQQPSHQHQAPLNNYGNPNQYQNHQQYQAPEDQYLPSDASQVALIATLGGFLGVLPAASLRWLNGGDFQLFPPPFRASTPTTGTGISRYDDSKGRLRQPLPHSHQPNDDRDSELDQVFDEDGDDNDNDDEDTSQSEAEGGSSGFLPGDQEGDDPNLEEYLASSTSYTGQHLHHRGVGSGAGVLPPDVLRQAMTQLVAFSEIMQQHVTVQQRVLQKLSSNSNAGYSEDAKNVTDGSMQMLRQQDQRSRSQAGSNDDEISMTESFSIIAPMWFKLVEIQVELTSLKRDYHSQNSGSSSSTEAEARLSQTLVRLENILQELEFWRKKREATPITGEAKGGSTVPDAPTNTLADSTCEDGGATQTDGAGATDVQATATTPNGQDSGVSKPIQEIPSCNLAVNAESCPESQTSTSVESPTPDEPSDYRQKLRQSTIDLVRKNAADPQALKMGFQVLFLYISNLSKNPHVPRYRKVFTSNESFKKVNRLEGGRDFLLTLGFVLSSDNRFLEWPPVQMDEDGVAPKALSTQEKEELVHSYHLSEVAAALAVLKTFSPAEGTAATGNEGDNSASEPIMALLEKALETLPYPEPLSDRDSTVKP